MRIFVFKKKNLYLGAALIVIIIIVVLLFWMMARDRTTSNVLLKYNYQNLLPEEAKKLMDNNPHIIVIDVRSEEDFNKGHLYNALVMPYKELKNNISQLNPNNTYLIYCNNGKESAKASKMLAKSGYPKVFTLVGGYKKWPYEIQRILNSDK